MIDDMVGDMQANKTLSLMTMFLSCHICVSE